MGTKTRKVLGERLLVCRESREEALPATAFGIVPPPAPPKSMVGPFSKCCLRFVRRASRPKADCRNPKGHASPLLCLALSFLHVAHSYLLG